MIKMTYQTSLAVFISLTVLIIMGSIGFFGLWHPMWALSLLFVWKGLPLLLRKVILVVDDDDWNDSE